ncbi:phosphatidylethanolamine/phosphatidyl-N-methylethanolamine N-methyltransferase [Entomortierella parvispora]|uniref:Phosphatidyl-N-methylethanolamine N-methyltransferase n=1 Tax=Entomortierella parvispora TaxID=205924 RepID=A0A9P3HK66_9FUNG|nr:phosphatidylethanolamine/phosphatidyl-N-methylethanolamine N-methyltransferase [Entomortierella parvispora]
MGVPTDSFEVSFAALHSPEFMEFLWNKINTPACQIAILSMILHVANYNVTARFEYNTHGFTKAIGKNAIYFYAVYLILSALVRDHFIHLAVGPDAGSFIIFPAAVATVLGAVCFVSGALLNLWTLKSLGIKGMYNGDSFGFLFDAPVTDGPYQYMSDPQYVGTTLSLVGTAIYYQSLIGYVLAADMYIIFWVSVLFFEGPHMNRIYSQKPKTE